MQRAPRQPRSITAALESGAAARDWAAAQLRRLEASARAESPRRRIAWAAVGVALVLAPMAFNLARESTYTASIEIYPRAVAPHPANADAGYFRAFLADPTLREQMTINTGAAAERYAGATFRHTRRGTVLLSVSSSDREEAQRLVNALAPQIVGATGRQLAAKDIAQVKVLRSQLRYQRLEPEERRALARRLRQLRRLGPEPPDRAVLGPPAPLPALERPADRLADALPGEFPKRSSPIAAGLAGLLLLATLWTIGLVLAPPAGALATRREAQPRRAGAVTWPAGLPRGTPAGVLALATLVFVAVIMVAGRHLDTFRIDEWAFVADRQGNSAGDFLRPHNEHLSVIPVAIFKALFNTVGLEPYWPYRLLVAAASVLIGVLVYLYARPRLGRGWALAPALLAMLIGQGGYDVVWPFQIGFLISVACGVGVLLCFDRPSPRSDLIAGTLVLVAVASSSIGLAVAVAAVVEVLASPGQRRARALRIVAVPLLLYAAWWLHYRPERADEPAGPYEALHQMIDLSGAATVGLFGTPISIRRLFAVALVAMVAVGLVRRAPDRRMLLVACSLPVAYWGLLILGRGSTGAELLDSRYILPGSIFIACILSEALRGSTSGVRPWVAGLVALGVLVGSVNHVRHVRDIASFEADARAEPTRAQAAALSLARQAGPVDKRAQLDPALIPVSSPVRLAEAFGRYGDPVAEPDAAISESRATSRAAADDTYLTARRLQPVPAQAPASQRPCRTLPGPVAEVAVPREGVVLRGSGRGPMAIALRRWSDAPQPAESVVGREWVRITPGHDSGRTPVRARIDGFDVRVCVPPAG